MLFGKKLGMDFWLFRSGQFLSMIGDGCALVAIAWLVLDKTGSPMAMSGVVAPALIVNIISRPLFGPLGDRYARKKIVATADFLRAAVFIAICLTTAFGFFNLMLLSFLYVINAIGTGLFGAVNRSIVPQLVQKEQIKSAVSQSEAINSAAQILGGIVGGIVVQFFGPLAAFGLNAVSFLLSGLMALLIRASTVPGVAKAAMTLKRWSQDVRAGFKATYALRPIFWLAIIAMLLNFMLAPLSVILPVLVKQEKSLPPWFYGTMQASLGIGAIIGVIILGIISKKLKQDALLIVGLAFMGLSFVIMGIAPGAWPILALMICAGMGQSFANVILGSQIAIALPDNFRSRISSTLGFFTNGIAPLSVALIGIVISGLGAGHTMAILGGCTIIMTPLLFVVPNFISFIRLETPEACKEFLSEKYTIYKEMLENK